MICVIFLQYAWKNRWSSLATFSQTKYAHILHKYIHILTYIKRTKNQQTNVLKYVRE